MKEPDLVPLAAAIGRSWAHELAHSLRCDDREVVGAWPGTLREARMRIRVAVRRHLDTQLLDELTHVANVAARGGWLELTKPLHHRERR